MALQTTTVNFQTIGLELRVYRFSNPNHQTVTNGAKGDSRERRGTHNVLTMYGSKLGKIGQRNNVNAKLQDGKMRKERLLPHVKSVMSTSSLTTTLSSTTRALTSCVLNTKQPKE